MTIVNIKVNAPANGSRVPARGSLRWEQSSRRVTSDGTLVLPAGFPVELVAGAAVVDVEPSTEAWVWRVTEFFDGQRPKTRYLAVPPSGPVNYTDLVPVDPVSFDPDTTLADGGDPWTQFDDTEQLQDGGTV